MWRWEGTARRHPRTPLRIICTNAVHPDASLKRCCAGDAQLISDTFKQVDGAHAVPHNARMATGRRSDEIIIVDLSGRGDKDIDCVAETTGV